MPTDERSRPATDPFAPASLWRTWLAAWEPRAAQAWEATVRRPVVVEPVAGAITLVGHMKAISDALARRVVRAFGVAASADQDRILYMLQRMESRILDLEERLANDGEVEP
jgi:hypothetical protein